jgi:hypothetical protein
MGNDSGPSEAKKAACPLSKKKVDAPSFLVSGLPGCKIESL